MTNELGNRVRRLVAAALIAAGALGVAGVGAVALTASSGNSSVAVECPPEKERC